jgi:hypothetical protein
MPTMAADVDALREIARAQPGAAMRSMGIKFPCPACRGEGHDTAGDNAILFNAGTWGCAWAKDTDVGLTHWTATWIDPGRLAASGSGGISPCPSGAGCGPICGPW